MPYLCVGNHSVYHPNGDSVLLPHQVKTQYLHGRFHPNYLFFTLKDISRRSPITKGSIYHIKPMYIQHFTTVVDWLEIGCLREVSTMFYILQMLRFYLGQQKAKNVRVVHSLFRIHEVYSFKLVIFFSIFLFSILRTEIMRRVLDWDHALSVCWDSFCLSS